MTTPYNMEEKLRFLLSTVNDWLKFAEGKNAALLVADSALIFGMRKLLVELHCLERHWLIDSWYTCGAMFLLVLGATCCLLSFVPQLNKPSTKGEKQPVNSCNLLFFGDIARYEPSAYLRTLYTQQDSVPEELSAVELDYAHQIVVNSRIAIKKYKFFNIALWFTLTAIITPLFTIPLYLFARTEGGRS